MTRANLKMTVRNRTALFWNLVFPALFILIFGAVLSNGQIDITVGVTGESSALQASTIEMLEQVQVFTPKLDGTTAGELQALEDGDRDVVLVFQPEPASGEIPGVK